jgi:hypothetical protein
MKLKCVHALISYVVVVRDRSEAHIDFLAGIYETGASDIFYLIFIRQGSNDSHLACFLLSRKLIDGLRLLLPRWTECTNQTRKKIPDQKPDKKVDIPDQCFEK